MELGGALRAAVTPLESGQFNITDQEFQRFQELIERTAGIHLTAQKRQLLCSRLAPRLRALKLTGFGGYWEFLQGDQSGDELALLVNQITTNKTSFFREGHHFEALAQKILLPFASGLARGEGRKLRIWSAACSSGEEPWSIAMTLVERLPSLGSLDVKVLATDIDTEMLAKASAGVYPLDRTEEMPRDQVARHFLRGSGSSEGLVRVRDNLRGLVTYRPLNFVEHPWPVKAQFDAIFCRNVLIYFTAALQRQVVDGLLARLRPGGLLLLGHSESMLGMRPELSCSGKTVFEKHLAGSPK